MTPLRGFLLTLLFLGAPTLTLGTVCLSLIQNNLRLSEENEELHSIASEVRAEVDSLGEEIDSLRERAGVPKGANEDKASELQSSELQSKESWSDSITRSISIEDEPEEAAHFKSGLLPRGGPANVASPIDLLKAAQKQMPELSRALDASVKPALERTLAEEAAYPDGQPVLGPVRVSSEFGIRSNPFGGGGYEVHEGIDFAGAVGDIIAATGDGVVTLASYQGGYGNMVTIDHGGGYETLYAHMSDIKVKVGETVKRGEIIGFVGNTGRSTGPHLHYGIYKGDEAVNPREVMKLSEEN